MASARLFIARKNESLTMSQTLTIRVPNDVYESLARAAEEAGQLPEALAAKWLAATAQRATDDPLDRFIGAFRSERPDWADEHDQYIGEAAAKRLKY